MPQSDSNIPALLLPGTPTPEDFDNLPLADQKHIDREASTSLVPIESTSHPDPVSLLFNPPPIPDEPVQTFRHRGWHQRRVRVAAALALANITHRRLGSFLKCGCQAWVLRSTETPTEFRVVPDFCHDRWCVPCAKGRAARIVANLLDHLQDRQARFLTLTLRADDTPLRARLDRLLAAFSKLRRRILWKDRVFGGAGFIEITRGATGTHWHVHLHVIMEGRYIAKEDLAATWLQITGDSYVVDIGLIKDQRDVGYYCTKYSTKPLDSKLQKQPTHLIEAINALRGRKLLYAFGTWSRWQLLTHPSDPAWTLYGHVNELLYRAANGDELADLVLLMLQHSPDVFAGDVFCIDLQPEPPPCPPNPPPTPSAQSLLF